jgi:osmotically-inducible protein OsmY
VREYGKTLCVERCPRGAAPSEDSMAAGAPSDELRAGQPGQEAPETPEFLDEHLGYAEVVDDGLGTAESELLYAVQDALDRYEPIRASGSRFQIRWREGSVVLTGRVRSLPIKALSELLARSASAGRPVVSELIADPQVAVDVATALARDPHTNLAPVAVECALGVVRLLGPVPSAAMASAAVEIARGVPGVLEVRSELVAAPAPAPTPAEAKVEAGATSEPTPETAFTSEPRLEPHGREQDADRVTKPTSDGERVPIADT